MKYDRNTIIDALEHCTRLDGDNFPNPNCTECPVMDDCKKCVGHIPYEMKEPLLELLKEQQAIIDELLKIGYPHNFQREEPWIVNYMLKITEVVKKAVHLRNGKKDGEQDV